MKQTHTEAVAEKEKEEEYAFPLDTQGYEIIKNQKNVAS